MKRTYNREFKVQACELVTKEGIKHAVVAEKMGINKVMLYRWIEEYETYGEEASRAIVDYIELYYNSERLHSGIGYDIPNRYFSLLSVH